MAEKKSIVILGAGFGGLRTATLLAKHVRRSRMEKSCEIVLIDRNAYHTYTPTLYETATTSKYTADYLALKKIVTFPIGEIVKNLPIRFLQTEVKSLDLANGDVHLLSGEKMKFDYLVLALGAETNYFEIPGMKEHSLPLKTFLDALKIRDSIFDLVQSGKTELKIIVGGGGSTGVELAGEIQGWLHELQEEFRHCQSKINIVEASPSLLLGFPAGIIAKVQKRLASFGTELVLNESIEKVLAGKAVLKSGRALPYDILIWTGGVKASALLGTLPLKLEKRGRVEVVGEMECLPQSPDLKLYGKIYGIGDAVCFYDPLTGRPIPGVARAALSQAGVVAENIVTDIGGRGAHKKYQPKNYPYVIPVGGKWAIAKLGPITVWGFWGWVLKGLVEINYLLSILPFWKAVKLWLMGLLIFIQNDRLG